MIKKIGAFVAARFAYAATFPSEFGKLSEDGKLNIGDAFFGPAKHDGKTVIVPAQAAA